MGVTEDPYGRITKEASNMVFNRLIVYMITVSCPEWEQYIFHKLRHFQMSGEIFELDVIEAVNKVDWILANKELKVIQLQPRISKDIRCFKDGKHYGHYLLPENVDCIYHIGDGCFWNVGYWN
jgi:hypothetical protein